MTPGGLMPLARLANDAPVVHVVEVLLDRHLAPTLTLALIPTLNLTPTTEP